MNARGLERPAGGRMKRLSLWVIILLSLPASATILQVQSAAKWSCSGTSCAQLFTLMNPAQHDLVVVWTFWQSTSTVTALAADNLLCQGNPCNTYLSAVGPTLQSSASTSAQIFYAKNFYNPNQLPVTVTVTFSGTGTISAAGVVIVEYSGADRNYPLDSVSAAYSYSPGNALDSGTAAPANANLLVFGAGIADVNTSGGLSAGSGFTSIQATHNSSIGSAITEGNTTAIAGDNVLQRATACLFTTMPIGTCLGVGNWVMQMAVFRDVSWTVTGAWTP